MKSRLALGGLLCAAAVFAWGASRLDAQQAADHDHRHSATEQTTQAATPAAGEMGAMMAAMKATDQKLDELVAKMNAAQGTAKVDAMAELLTAMISDRKTMHESMMSHMGMMKMMMGNMPEHGASKK